MRLAALAARVRGVRRTRRGALPDQAWPLQFTAVTCEPVADAPPRTLGLSYWYTPPESGDPYSFTIKFVGRRRDGPAPDGGSSSFEVVHEVSPVIPGTGQAALTVRVEDVADGRWDVTAVPGRPVDLRTHETAQAARPGTVAPLVQAVGSPAFGPLVRVRAPGTRTWAWPAMVLLGFLAALVLQQALARRETAYAGQLLVLTLVAGALGLVGAKVYYLITHPEARRRLTTTGMSVQGFVLVFVAVLVAGTAVSAVSLGGALDLSTPPLLAGMAIGRTGCFFGGCCVGRPTGSRWGLWCSDRTWGTRRIPVQLLESVTAGVLAIASLTALTAGGTTGRGLVFAFGMASYVMARQLLFPLRAIPRSTRYGRPLVLVASCAVAVVSGVLLLVAGRS